MYESQRHGNYINHEIFVNNVAQCTAYLANAIRMNIY